MCKELGYEQLTGTIYVKQREGWYESFGLQASSYGNDFFYINYGIMVPNQWPPFEDEPNLKNEGLILSNRLYGDDSQGFNNATKDDIVASAGIALEKYNEQALPWFSKFKNLKDIAERYFETTHLDKTKLGKHDYYAQLSAANYGLLLRLCGDRKESLEWLKEAERLMSLPVYFTRDGRTVHEREKYARICKPEDYEVDQLENIRSLILELENA